MALLCLLFVTNLQCANGTGAEILELYNRLQFSNPNCLTESIHFFLSILQHFVQYINILFNHCFSMDITLSDQGTVGHTTVQYIGQLDPILSNHSTIGLILRILQMKIVLTEKICPVDFVPILSTPVQQLSDVGISKYYCCPVEGN